MITKAVKQFTDAMGRTKIKGNMDVEIAVTALQIADHIDHAVLLTGDGDFVSLVAALQGELRRQADQFVDLAQLENDFSRDRAPTARP